MKSLDPLLLRRLVEGFLAEDIGRGDLTTTAIIDPTETGTARLEAREPAVIAGLAAARACFDVVEGREVAWTQHVTDGDRVDAGKVLARVDARLASILTAERTALNLLGHLLGVATSTAAFVDAVADLPARILDTRKTTPGLRVLEKYAVAVGGGTNHRAGLDDGILIKDNHIAAAGSVTAAVAGARAAAPHGLRVEVEVEDLDQLDDAVAAGADAVLLDNMDVDSVKAAVARAGGKVLIEVSGGITLDNVRSYAAAGADFISVGRITRSAPSIDVALEIER